MEEEQRDIILCRQCRGTGKVPRRNSDGSLYVLHGKPVADTCPVCDGTGRLLRIINIRYSKITPAVIEDSTENGKTEGLLGRIYGTIKHIFTNQKVEKH